MTTRGKLIVVAVIVVVALIGGCGPLGFWVWQELQPSRVSVVNRSGFPLEDLVVISEPDRHTCAELPAGQAYTVTVEPSDSHPVDISFTYQGRRYGQRDFRNISSRGDQCTVTVLPGGTSVQRDYGGGPKSVYEAVAEE